MSPFSLDHIMVSSNSDSPRYAPHNGRVPLSLVPLPYAVNDRFELWIRRCATNRAPIPYFGDKGIRTLDLRLAKPPL